MRKNVLSLRMIAVALTCMCIVLSGAALLGIKVSRSGTAEGYAELARGVTRSLKTYTFIRNSKLVKTDTPSA